MTENMFGAAMPAAPVAEEPESGNRRVLLLGGVAAALVLGGGGYFLLLGGSSSTPAASAPVVHFPSSHAAPTSVVPAVAKPAAKAKLALLPVTSTAPIGRDPFRALYVQPAAVAATGGGATTASAPSSSSGTGTSSSGTSTPTATTPTTHPLTLTKVSSGTAEFVVDGKVMLAKPGSIFGPTGELKLLSLSQNSKGVWVATIQVGDGQPFDAVQNQKVYVN